MRNRWLLVMLCIVFVAEARAQVAVARLRIESGGVTFTGWVGYVDLKSGPFQPYVRGSDCAVCDGWPSVMLQDSYTFAYANPRMVVGITANSGANTNNAPDGACETWKAAGLIVSNRMMVNPPQVQGPTLYFRSNSDAVITARTLPCLTDIQWAIAGSTNTDNDCPNGMLGTLLVENGWPGKCPIPKSKIAAARTGAGLTDKGVLILAIVQGQEPNEPPVVPPVGPGMLSAMFAQLMIDLGAHNAVNLDGGGSTAFLWNLKKVHVVEETALHDLVHDGGGLKVVPDWKDVNGSYCTNWHDDLCTGSDFRPVYANFGILALGP